MLVNETKNKKRRILNYLTKTVLKRTSNAIFSMKKVNLYHSHKKQIVWKLGPNGPFYALMLRTKLYYNPFFFTGHQNVNKQKSRAARTVYGLIFFTFL